MFNIHDFLSLNRPTNGDMLVVEGWIKEDSLMEIVTLFNNSRYNYIVTFENNEEESANRNSNGSSDGVSAILIRYGVPRDKLFIIRHEKLSVHKTLSSARLLFDWIAVHQRACTAFDIATVTVHARKTFMIYRNVFRNKIDVGVVAVKTNKYDQRLWFLSFNGMYLVLRNTIGFLYAAIVGFFTS